MEYTPEQMANLVRDPEHLEKCRAVWRENTFVHQLILEVERLRQNNKDTLAVKLQLNEENKRLVHENEELHRQSSLRQRTIEQMRAAEPVSPNQQMLEQMIADLRGLANPQNPTVPPLSTACLRQHAAMSALNGLLADGTATSAAPTMAVRLADSLIKELEK